MASQYNIEPQPTAKVILNTTAGDLTLELFGKQTPLATRNFLQHCLDGYYTNTIFHRLVPGFILQGGDPTGTGSGGISAVNGGEPFEDEFHSRLKFNRRGLLGMANEGTDSNASQFFFTLGPTPELQGKNTMFGRTEGDTIFNLMKIAESELVEGSERPLYPARVTGCEILVNPYPDMVARARVAPRSKVDEKSKDVKKRKKPMGKNVLSFGEDGDEGVVVPVAKKSKMNPRLAAAEVDARVDVAEVPLPTTKETVDLTTEKIPQKDKPLSKAQRPRSPTSTPEPQQLVSKPLQPAEDVDDGSDEDRGGDDRRQAALDRSNAEIAALKASMRRSNDNTEKAKEKPRSALEAMIPSTSTRGRKRGKAQDDNGALDMFNAFRSKLDGMPSTANETAKQIELPTETTEANNGADEEAELCDLHFIANCQSCRAWDDEKPDGDAEEDEDDTSWMSHKLTFAKDTLGKDLEWRRKLDEIEVIDPKEKARAIQEDSRKSRRRK